MDGQRNRQMNREKYGGTISKNPKTVSVLSERDTQVIIRNQGTSPEKGKIPKKINWTRSGPYPTLTLFTSLYS